MASKSSKDAVTGLQNALLDEWRAWHVKHAAAETPPKGAIEATAYAKANGISVGAARMILQRKSDQGELETGIFRTTSERKTGQRRFWWLPKKRR